METATEGGLCSIPAGRLPMLSRCLASRSLCRVTERGSWATLGHLNPWSNSDSRSRLSVLVS